jgi:uncharacterized membrane protein
LLPAGRGVIVSISLLDALLLAVHVPSGVIAVISGAAAMLSDKGSQAHRRRGRWYLGALLATCVSGTGLVATRWPHFPHLLVLGIVAAALAGAGYASRRRAAPSLHLAAMGASYIVLLTAFYVDNGPKLPLWNRLPATSFWFLPSALGIPVIVRSVLRRGRRVA